MQMNNTKNKISYFLLTKMKDAYRKKVQILNPSFVHIKDMCVSQGYINRCTDCKIANKLVPIQKTTILYPSIHLFVISLVVWKFKITTIVLFFCIIVCRIVG